MASTPLILILLGPPGSGKGTQALLLQQHRTIPHISTGDILREHIQRQTELGKKAQTFIDKGELVPDALVLDLLFQRVAERDCAHGYILDGFPRTLPQARALDAHLTKAHLLCINLDLQDAEVIQRLSKRVTCSVCKAPYHLTYSPPHVQDCCDKCGGKLVQRSDDTPEVIRQRLKVYYAQTAPLIDYYTSKNVLHTIDCAQPREKVFQEILHLVEGIEPKSAVPNGSRLF